MNIFENEIHRLLESHSLKGFSIETPPNPDMGDFAVPCFSFAKALKKSPNNIASEIAASIHSDYFESIISNGPYINFFASPKKFAEDTLKAIKKGYGKTSLGEHKKVMIEFSSPNTNKPLHLGHIRNILLGESLSRIYEKTSHKVIRACLVNDRGVHICKSMLAYKKFGNKASPDKKTDHFVGDWYVRFSNEAKDNPELEKEAQEMLVKWEKKDPETLKLWEKMNKWVYDGFDETYKSLGVSFEKIYYESSLYDKGKEIAIDGLKKGLLEKDEKGNIVAPLSKHGFPDDKVVLRADGTTVYITQDIYLAKLKFEEYSLDKSFYVVGSEQNLHFQQLFKIIEILKLAKTSDLFHISYGMVYLPEGKMKSREGTVVDADDLVLEVTNLAREEVDKRYPELLEHEKEVRARMIGVGALKFFMLKVDPARDMTYNPKESVSFDGETGPYVQYAYARINSIFEKGGIETIPHIDFSLFDASEKQIIKHLAKYPSVIDDSAKAFRPSLIARYLLDLAQMFSEYYHTHQILKEKDELKAARLYMIDKIRYVLKDGLQTLGIDAPERM